jgi:hypothetical protein
MKARKQVQAVSIGGVILTPGQTKVVETAKITPQQRALGQSVVIIRDLHSGKSQVTLKGS